MTRAVGSSNEPAMHHVLVQQQRSISPTEAQQPIAAVHINHLVCLLHAHQAQAGSGQPRCLQGNPVSAHRGGLGRQLHMQKFR
jgi:hypothetical protein